MKKHVFNAGPAILPEVAKEKTIDAIRDFAGTGISLLEVSHRSKDFQAVMDESTALFKELLGVPEGYAILWLGGGASTQFFSVPYNLLRTKAGYLDTDTWSAQAIKEAKLFGEVVVVASSKEGGYKFIPKDYVVPEGLDYFHITSNNTIAGTEIFAEPKTSAPLIADMSSNILSRPIDVSKYGLIYGGAQKNLAPAGVTFVIVREDLLGKVERAIPSMVDYRTHIAKGSLFNTPPVMCIFSALQALKWLKEMGGVKEMEKRNIAKANLIYNTIDNSRLFMGNVAKEDRSRMNATFSLKKEDKDLEKEFLDFAAAKGMVGVKGHRSVGGFRASIYNAMPIESVQALVDCMKEFEAAH